MELDLDELRRLCSMAQYALAVRLPGRSGLIGFCVTFAPGVDYASLNYTWFSARYESFCYLDRIVVDPVPAETLARDDYFGNPVTQITLATSHQALTVRATALDRRLIFVEGVPG